MRESRTYGSVRGAPSNGRPYRDQRQFAASAQFEIGRIVQRQTLISGDRDGVPHGARPGVRVNSNRQVQQQILRRLALRRGQPTLPLSNQQRLSHLEVQKIWHDRTDSRDMPQGLARALGVSLLEHRSNRDGRIKDQSRQDG